jgi:hypothetical protein
MAGYTLRCGSLCERECLGGRAEGHTRYGASLEALRRCLHIFPSLACVGRRKNEGVHWVSPGTLFIEDARGDFAGAGFP